MNLGEMKVLCSTRFDDPISAVVSTGDPAANVAALTVDSLPDWENYINQAYHDLWTEARYKLADTVGTVTLNAGSATVSLPTDVDHVRFVLDRANDQYLDPVEGYEARATWQLDADEDRGQPAVYWVSGTVLNVHPIPDANRTLTILYTAAPTDLAADSDAPLIPVRYHRNGICARALQLACLDDEQFDRAKMYESMYARTLINIRRDLLGPKRGRYSSVPPAVLYPRNRRMK